MGSSEAILGGRRLWTTRPRPARSGTSAPRTDSPLTGARVVEGQGTDHARGTDQHGARIGVEVDVARELALELEDDVARSFRLALGEVAIQAFERGEDAHAIARRAIDLPIAFADRALAAELHAAVARRARVIGPSFQTRATGIGGRSAPLALVARAAVRRAPRRGILTVGPQQRRRVLVDRPATEVAARPVGHPVSRDGGSAALLAALAAGRCLLRLVAAAAAAAALLAAAAAAALPAPARRARRVRDRGRARLAHALLAQPLVLLVVLHARSMVLCHWFASSLGVACIRSLCIGLPGGSDASFAGRRAAAGRRHPAWQ